MLLEPQRHLLVSTTSRSDHMQDDVIYDSRMARTAFQEVRLELLTIAKAMEETRTAQDLVETSVQLRAAAERFDSLTRMIIDLQRRAVI